jgi:hypothetical protein
MSIRQLSVKMRHSRASIANMLKNASLDVLAKPLSLEVFDDAAVQLLRRTPELDAKNALVSFCEAIADNRLENNSSFLVKEISVAQKSRIRKTPRSTSPPGLLRPVPVRAPHPPVIRRPALDTSPALQLQKAPSPILRGQRPGSFFKEPPRQQLRPSPLHQPSAFSETVPSPRQQVFSPRQPSPLHFSDNQYGIQPASPQLSLLHRPLAHSAAPFLRVIDDALLEGTLPRCPAIGTIGSPAVREQAPSPPSPMSQLLTQASVASLGATPAQETDDHGSGWLVDWSSIAAGDTPLSLDYCSAAVMLHTPPIGTSQAVAAAWGTSSSPAWINATGERQKPVRRSVSGSVCPRTACGW